MACDWLELKQDVPQGTVLRPLLINIYLNELASQISLNALKIQYPDYCLLTCISQSKLAFNHLWKKVKNLGNYLSLDRLNLEDS